MSELDFFDFNATPIKRNYNRKLEYDKSNILISIVTPYYNAKKVIFDIAKSILAQTFPCFEWIIVNDGSTEEGTQDVLEELENMDDRFFVYNKSNEGLDLARRYGYSKAKSNIIFNLETNYIIDNTLLECGFFSLYTNKDAKISYANVACIDDKKLYSVIENKDEKTALDCFFAKKEILINDFKEELSSVGMSFYGSFALNKDFNPSLNFSLKEYLKFPLKNNNEYLKYPYLFKEEFKIFNKSNNKKILFIIPWAVFGGADLFNLNYIKYLKENEYEISIITTEVHDYELRQKFEEYTDEFFDLSTFLKRKDWPAFIAHIIRTRNIDTIFQCNSMYGYIVIPWLKSMFPDVHIVDFLHAEQWEWRDGGYPRDSIAISNFLDKTYVCSKHLADVMEKDMNKRNKNTEVIYLGIDTDKFDPSAPMQKLNDELLSKIAGKKVILFPCRLAYIKRPILMLKILKKMVEKQRDVILLVVGSGQALSDMQDFTYNNNLSEFVEFVGYKDDVRPYYMVSDVTLITSLSEGITLTTYESLAMGVPVITSDVGGQKELVDSTVGAVLKNYQSKSKDEYNFDYSDEEINQYVNEIVRILNLNDEERINLKKCCRNRILEKFSSKIMYKKLKESIEELNYKYENKTKEFLNNEELFERYIVNFNEKDYIQKELDNMYHELENINDLLCSKESCISELNSIIAQKSKEIDIKSEEIVAIKSSRSYKIIEKLRKLINKS